MKPVYKWKFLKLDNEGNIVSNYNSEKWVVGEWKKTKKKPKACKRGYHCSNKLYQAYSYVAGTVLAKVEVTGKCDADKDKYAYQEMRIVKAWEWDKLTSVKLAIYAAELVIDIYEKQYPKDERPRKAIEAAKKYLEKPSKKAADAARAAAYAADAAADAAYAAHAARAADAARAAAHAAHAARAAAHAAHAADAADAAAHAADAAHAAAHAAALITKIDKYMNKLAKDLKEIK